MIQTVLVQVPVALRVLTRCKEVDAIQFCFCDNRTFINDNPVDIVTSWSKSLCEVMSCIESCNIPYLNELHTVKRRYTSFNRCSLILYLDNTFEFFGTFQRVHRFARKVYDQVRWSVL